MNANSGLSVSYLSQNGDKLIFNSEEIHIELPKSKGVDESIFEASKKIGDIVATNDRILRKRLRNINIPVIYLRGKSRLCLEGIESEYIGKTAKRVT